MTTVLDDRVAIGRDGDGSRARAGRPDASANHAGDGRRRAVVVVAVFAVLMATFAVHLARFGAWVVDDAGISMAYAGNLAHGHGLVAKPGAQRVEAFSDPLWVGLLAAFSRAGLLGRVDLLGLPGYVLVVKGLALVLQGVVLACLALVIRRVLTVVQGRPPSLGGFVAVWAGAGLLLAANPSYVVWMGSGLENPLYAAEVAALAAVATRALPAPDRRAVLALGGLAGLAALTRPDGVVYASIVVIVALLAQGPGVGRRARLAGWGLLAFGGVFGTYVAFRVAYFGALVPNTAIAKDQGLPSVGDLARLATMTRAYGWPLVVTTLAGGVVAFATLRQARNHTALRVLAGGAAVLGAGIAAYVILPDDWMAELRFLTPVWPLLSTVAVLAIARITTLARARHVRAAIALTLVVLAALVVPGWWERTRRFRASPTLPLCFVAARYGVHFDESARTLGRARGTTSVLLADIGGVLLASDADVVDLAGLADERIARLLRDGAPPRVADYVLEDVRPTLVHLHDDWVARSGLLEDPRFGSDYVAVLEGEEWVRRDALPTGGDAAATLTRLRAAAASLGPPPPRASCAATLFG